MSWLEDEVWEDEVCFECGHPTAYHDEPEPDTDAAAILLRRLPDNACPDCSVCLDNLWK
jgi:hypothetical protein